MYLFTDGSARLRSGITLEKGSNSASGAVGRYLHFSTTNFWGEVEGKERRDHKITPDISKYLLKESAHSRKTSFLQGAPTPQMTQHREELHLLEGKN